MKSLNIVTLLGSGNGLGGNTGRAVTALLKTIIEEHPNLSIDHQLFSIRDTPVAYCLGYKTCFHKGVCPLDKDDSLPEIKEKLLKADLVIIGSPVYSGHTSGYLKNLIDRLSYWTHLMELAGKMCVIVVSAQGNGINETANYLFEIASFLGMSVIGTVYKSNFYPSETIKQQIMPIIIRLNHTIINNQVTSNQFLDSKFLEFQQLFRMIHQKNVKKHHEAEFWANHHYLELHDFQELIQLKKNISPYNS
ncbi:flavodoxin family protein [Carnobacterium maltaromaticum]|uniref:flavodoxin family protein n=1 Tax=Carnobacterium maltaromaticum TaxID=2751 RepID=UPI00295F0339|nr:flavodoxin family protein [Carnobacterium maltaromaticum]